MGLKKKKTVEKLKEMMMKMKKKNILVSRVNKKPLMILSTPVNFKRKILKILMKRIMFNELTLKKSRTA